MLNILKREEKYINKNVLVISTSPRVKGNSNLLADEFIRGVKETDNIVEKISLHDKAINFCKGCLACQKTKQCVIKDDANWIAQKMLKADVIVFTTPVYYYGMSGQMKTMLDRANPLYTADYSFRDIYLLASAADEDESAVDGTITGIQGWISCFEKAELKGYVFAGGVDGVGAIKGHEALQKAYEMGKAI
ncbi:MAG: flavodoxin family protein [Longibaculum muris]|uniref:Multimeric flavodoxin WrbA n=1 Tax=Longibaculum muris TaxID=1796628 RepID=A0A4R3YQ97_9FIRM|nr:flavin reductase [Candidatus Stoquefichus sp. KLE1796]MBS5369163.1 flavodoxin family protein [Coprobacillus cateniformis]MED9811527.1 flavodoxin family protein [Longibaculum muris]TCV93093.1 multimeric flavodoxin WrbA [Longibaculum muris]